MKNRKGFSLIELVIVISILSLIALITIPSARNAIVSINNKKYESIEKQILDRAKLYIEDHQDTFDTQSNNQITDIKSSVGYLLSDLNIGDCIINCLTVQKKATNRFESKVKITCNKGKYVTDNNCHS